ncbi:52 kDa repressor of the inhibitor of the protein kinase [Nephila pilipes]|uniref:52 kDa repressor of the inhibitor of the protein kinase n=1 Tax=Nephila pilipes TaxID=299642 RepID=A0A8X6MZG9_NEPPI|nr:52 kDa repressor of the inhibitor of the protein kinase [Nephila pilipes]
MLKRVIEKFRHTGSIGDAKHTDCPKASRSNITTKVVRENVGGSPGTSIRRRGQELQISRISLQQLLTEDLRLQAYNIQFTQELKPNAHAPRRAR